MGQALSLVVGREQQVRPSRKSFEQALGTSLSRLTDGSLKVGIQGYDSNRWRLDEILFTLDAYGKFAEAVLGETGKSVGPLDVWGGGQVSQVPRFLGEDPFDNLSKIKSVVPELTLKCIYRGRQAFGFLPTSEEIQRAAIFESASRGMQVFRMFDPLNDATNIAPGLAAVNEYRKEQTDRGTPHEMLVSAEALVFYVRPPRNTPAVWTPRDLCEYAVKLAAMGFHEISLADYSQQIPSPSAAASAIRRLRAALDEGGFPGIAVNFFAQGERPAINRAALLAGAKSADVAIGDLSGGLSNTNIRPLLHMLLQDHGFDISLPNLRTHPVLQKLADVESVISAIAENHRPYRMEFSKADAKTLSDSRLAFNAVSALDSAIVKNWNTLIQPSIPAKYVNRWGKDSKLEYLRIVFRKNFEVWLAGGQFNPVSPFGYISSFQAEALARAELAGRKLPLGHYRRDFQELLKGRFGRNLGVEKELCDTGLVRAFHILEVLQILWSNREVIGRRKIELFLLETDLSKNISYEVDEKNGRVPLFEIDNSPKVETILREADFAAIAGAIDCGMWSADIRKILKFAISQEKFPLPGDGLEIGMQLAAELELETGIEFNVHSEKGIFLSEKERVAMSMLLFKVNSRSPYSVTKDLYKQIKVPRDNTFYGDIEEDIRPLDILLKEQVLDLADVLAKSSLLEEIRFSPYLRSNQIAKCVQAISGLQEKYRSVIGETRQTLVNQGYCEASEVPRRSLPQAEARFVAHCRRRSEIAVNAYRQIPPALWNEHRQRVRRLLASQ
ncbi:beta/alpha barrel domain-containing protein [Rhizobium laguerreae]|uniref:hypothetical protein n=1 Tax=Rhizobium laguerreae TaxID=1076926 RepID=UPI001C90AB51|nr:hypothetical protein [Rhizobium laguerreae]MBY3561758.1 hypothetical protein [Rhizobium laguerreae]